MMILENFLDGNTSNGPKYTLQEPKIKQHKVQKLDTEVFCTSSNASMQDELNNAENSFALLTPKFDEHSSSRNIFFKLDNVIESSASKVINTQKEQ